MTPTEKRKFLEAVDEIERREGTDAPLAPKAICGLFLATFPDLWERKAASARAIEARWEKYYREHPEKVRPAKRATKKATKKKRG